MKRSLALAILFLVGLDGVAQAQTAAEFYQSCVWPLKQPRGSGFATASWCPKYELTHFSSNTGGKPHETVELGDGTLKSGVRQSYDESRVQLLASDGSYFSSLNQARLGARIASSPLHAAWENDSPSINSCSEYAYKQYYQASRFTDALTAVNTDYEAAYQLIMNGAPASTARPLPPLAGAALTDFDGRPLLDKDRNQTGVFSPTHIVSTMNAFRNFGNNIFMRSAVNPADASVLAWAQAAANPQTLATDDWSYARLMHAHPDVASLSPSERDSIASRLSAMDGAWAVFEANIGVCFGQSYTQQTGSTAVTNDATLRARLSTLVQLATGGGYTDFGETQMLNQLLDPSTRGALIQKLSTAEASGQMDPVTARFYYGTRSGSFLARLAYLDAAGLSRTLDSLHSATLNGAACGPALGALATATALMVSEYKRVDHGCLGASQKCEWSAPLFVRDVTARLRTAEANADHTHKVCVDLYSETVAYAPAAAKASLSSFDTELRAYEVKLKQDWKDAPHSSHFGNVGQHEGKSGKWGDDQFGASYDYFVDWGMKVAAGGHSSDGRICQLDGKVEAKLTATGKLMGREQEIVAGDVSVASDTGLFHADINLFGQALFTPIDQSLTNPYSFEKMSHDRVPLFEDTIVLVFIPVTIDAGVSFDYGFGLTASLVKGPCNPDHPQLTISATAGPKAGVSAYFSASVDAGIASVGIECDLVLVEAGLPATVGVSVKPDPTNQNALFFDVSAGLDVTLKELAGKISLVIKVLEIDVYDQTMFKWSGLKQKFHLWGDHWHYPIVVFDATSLG